MPMVNKKNKSTKNYTQKSYPKPKARPVKDLTFTVSMKKDNTGVEFFYIKDNLGFICGISKTEAEAIAAIPLIKYNLERGFVPYKLLKIRHRTNSTIVH